MNLYDILKVFYKTLDILLQEFNFFLVMLTADRRKQELDILNFHVYFFESSEKFVWITYITILEVTHLTSKYLRSIAIY